MGVPPAIESIIRDISRKNDIKILFCCLFGSSLYGTRIEGKSDLDIKGIFLPSLSSCILGSAPQNICFSTGSGASRNHAKDVDIEFWSLQNWLLSLLPAGDTGAMDLLFAPSNESCVIRRDPVLDSVFSNPLRLVNINGASGYASYSIGQAKKYGIKGSRLGAIKRVHEWLAKNCPHPERHERLESYLEKIAAQCGQDAYCAIISKGCEHALQLCGKIHLASTRVAEFKRRIDAEFEQYGGRAVLAEQNQGLDFKALSHAVRALDQMLELGTTGAIVYPLKNRKLLIDIKQGKYSWASLEKMIVDKLGRVNRMMEDMDLPENDLAFARKIVLDCYANLEIFP